MTDTPFVVIALLLLAAFLVGGVLGYLARRYVLPGKGRTTRHRAQTAEEILEREMNAADEAIDAETGSETAMAPADDGAPAGPPAGVEIAPSPVHTENAQAEAMREPPLLSEPRDGKRDNLKKIKGIGPKLEEELNGVGVYHFDQVAGWDDQSAAWIDAKLDLRGRIARDGWVAQAQALVARARE